VDSTENRTSQVPTFGKYAPDLDSGGKCD